MSQKFSTAYHKPVLFPLLLIMEKSLLCPSFNTETDDEKKKKKKRNGLISFGIADISAAVFLSPDACKVCTCNWKHYCIRLYFFYYCYQQAAEISHHIYSNKCPGGTAIHVSCIYTENTTVSGYFNRQKKLATIFILISDAIHLS